MAASTCQLTHAACRVCMPCWYASHLSTCGLRARPPSQMSPQQSHPLVEGCNHMEPRQHPPVHTHTRTHAHTHTYAHAQTRSLSKANAYGYLSRSWRENEHTCVCVCVCVCVFYRTSAPLSSPCGAPGAVSTFAHCIIALPGGAARTHHTHMDKAVQKGVSLSCLCTLNRVRILAWSECHHICATSATCLLTWCGEEASVGGIEACRQQVLLGMHGWVADLRETQHTHSHIHTPHTHTTQ